MKPTNALKLSVATAVLFLGAGNFARAFEIVFTPTPTSDTITDGTYTFESTDGNTFADGSTVTIAGDPADGYYLSAWNILDTSIGDFPATPANSSLYAFDDTIGNNEWSFQILGLGYNELGQDEIGGSSLNIDADPSGTWTLNGAPSVPDSSGTFDLLAGALIALGIGASVLRSRAVRRAW
ncbi:MAG: hypothetical protein ABSA05_15690 [Opitutaceae bacterium]|jgi:hypothetical protein